MSAFLRLVLGSVLLGTLAPRLSGAVAPRPAGPVISRVTHGSGFHTYQLIELRMALRAKFSNPFDPSQIDVNAIFTDPAGRQYRVNGFYYQNYANTGAPGALGVRPSGAPGWRIRFAAPAAGAWRYTVYVRDRTGRVASSSMGSPLAVAQGGSPGYVRVSRYDPHYLVFDNGASYFPVGENMAFWYHGIADYYYWLRRKGGLRGSGANVIRVWMAPQKDSVDFSYPLGNYRSSMQYAWALDQILTWAHQDHLHVILTLALHASLQHRQDHLWDWPINPYNRRMGGPASSPCQFFSNPTAIAMFQRNLRYVVARWGYATSILAWELFNEVDLVEGYQSCRTQVVQWHRTMIATLHQLDPAHHLITTTFAHLPADPRIWSLPGLDIVQSNHYSTNIPAYITADVLTLRAYGKPALMGEFAPSPRAPGPNTGGWYIHDAQWASLLAGGAGGALNWYWDDYVDMYHLYWVYRAVPRFVAGIQLDREGFTPSPPGFQTTGPGDSAWVYRLPGRDITLLWVRRAGGRSAGAVSIPVSGNRKARIEWWDTVRGVPIRTVSVQPRQGTLTIPLPGTARDYAAKVWE